MNSCLFPRKLLVEYTIRTADFAVLFLVIENHAIVAWFKRG